MKRFLPKSEFGLNVLTLMTGTGIAQIIPIMATPILTRLYSPEEFGVFAMYLAITTILALFITGRYELAIMQPKNDEEGEYLCKLSLCLTFLISLLFFISLLLGANWLNSIKSITPITHLLYFIPILTFLLGTHSSLNYLLNRRKKYSTISKNKVIQSITTSIVSITFGLLGVAKYGLTAGLILGYSLSTILLLLNNYKNLPRLNIYDTRKIAKKYKSYPIYDIPSSTFSLAAHQMPILLFTPIFGSIYSGYYYLVERIFLAPIGLISSSIGAVFRQRALEEKNELGRYDKIFLKIAVKLFIIGTPIFTFFTFYSTELFSFLLGEKWSVAGKYAETLAPMFLLKFIASPLSYSLYISGKLQYNLIGQLTYSLLIGTSIIIGFVYQDISTAISSISISGSIIYLMYFLVSLKLSFGE